MDYFSYLLQDIDPLLLDDMDFPINSCGKSNNYMKDLGSKINGEKVEGPEIFEHFLYDNKSQDFGFVSEFSSGYNHNFKKIESVIDSDNFKKQDSTVEDSSLLPAKQTRAAAKNYASQIPVCQVQGCCKDLRSSKDYHRKNRVCAIHAKSAKVFVNGIEKRFCQQCSRFHLLKEFDDVKRSCRKRLAGHNERRRKPYIVPHIGEASSLLEMDLVKSEPFFLREKNPTSFYYQEKYVKLRKIPGAKEVEFPKPFAPSLLSFNSKKYANNSSQHPKPLHPEITKTCPDYKTTKIKSFEHSGLSTLNSFIQFENFPKYPITYDDTAVICSETERYYYKDRRFHEAGSTLDLQHLSPHLRRVEKLQNSVQLKQENITFSCI